MKHTLDISDVKEFKFEYSIAGSFGKQDQKELLAVVTPVTSTIEYRVVNWREIVFSSDHIEDAIDYYNSI